METKPTDILEAEHRVIEKVVAAMAVLSERLQAGQEVDAQTLRDVVTFMRTFADKCHHGKEETHLFPALEKRGVPVRGCPIGALLHEHQAGRTLVGELAEATQAYVRGAPGIRDGLLKALRGLTELYPSHIWKEDYLLFPMTEKILSPEDAQTLYEEFGRVEAAIGRDEHGRFEQLAEVLEQRTREL